jgi:hypothetical protein
VDLAEARLAELSDLANGTAVRAAALLEQLAARLKR